MDLNEFSMLAWQEDQRTNPTAVNPHAYAYGYRAGYRRAVRVAVAAFNRSRSHIDPISWFATRLTNANDLYMTKSTNKDLVELLQQRNTGNKYDQLIQNALAGMYHDWKSEEATPKMLLREHLGAFPELNDIAEMVMKGDFDEDFDS